MRTDSQTLSFDVKSGPRLVCPICQTPRRVRYHKMSRYCGPCAISLRLNWRIGALAWFAKRSA